MASVVKVNEDYVWSVDGNVVSEGTFKGIRFTVVVVFNSSLSGAGKATAFSGVVTTTEAWATVVFGLEGSSCLGSSS